MRKGGIAAWSIHHPVSTIMLALAVVVPGFFALGRLSIDLLPRLIYPQIRIHVLDPELSSAVMEDKVTGPLEKRLATTRGVIGLQSMTSEGSSTIDLDFRSGNDVDAALHDAADRLDRVRPSLPVGTESPLIFKLDSAQMPVVEFVVSSPVRDRAELRTWTDDVFAKHFLSIDGVAAVKVGGGLVREIQVLPDQLRLAGLGLSVDDIIQAIRQGNVDTSTARPPVMPHEQTDRPAGRLTSVAAIAGLPVRLPSGDSIPLSEVAQVEDSHEQERIRVRYNGVPGVSMAIQERPGANTVDVADRVAAHLAWLRANSLIPKDINVDVVSDQSVYVRRSLQTVTMTAVAGAVLAMAAVYLFIGSIARTLIIGAAIPISMMAAFVIMVLGGLTLNIMTLGGLALGVGMLVASSIVMMENIAYQQRSNPAGQEAAIQAAAEVNNTIVASTTTTLVAVLPLLFISGVFSLLFGGLVFTILAAIAASLMVALTLVPSLAAMTLTTARGRMRAAIDWAMERAQSAYAGLLDKALRARLLVVIGSMTALLIVVTATVLWSARQDFLPALDDGRVTISVVMDPGTSIDAMDRAVQTIERVAWAQGSVRSVYSLVGGRIFGRSEHQANRSTVDVQLAPLSERAISSREWIDGFSAALDREGLVGVSVRPRIAGIRGLRFGRANDDISVHIQGPDLGTLARLGKEVAQRLRGTPGLRNVRSSGEDRWHEFSVQVDRQRAAELGVDVNQIGRAMRIAVDGLVVSKFVDGDHSYDIRVQLRLGEFTDAEALGGVLLVGAQPQKPAVYLRDVAKVSLVSIPAEIRRQNQRRIVEVTGSLRGNLSLGEVSARVRQRLSGLQLPSGYVIYSDGTDIALQQGRHQAGVLVGLALLLVFVALVVQYESLRNSVVVVLSVPFVLMGAGFGLYATGLPLSMPVWLGMIMLVGMGANNAIVSIAYVEILRQRGVPVREAIIESSSLRLRSILITTLTTVVGMLPLTLGIGEGVELLQPLAVTLVAGLLFSMVVSLILVPVIYTLFHPQSLASAVVKAA